MGLFTDGFKLLKKESEPLYKTPKSVQETIEIMAVAEIGIFERYCKFLNSLDCNYKIAINNKNKNMEDLRDKVLITEKNDGFNNYRRIYNDIIEEKIIEGRQGIEQERYLTITIKRKNFEEAKAQFATLEATIHKIPLSIMQKKALTEAQERLNARCEQIKSQVSEIKVQVKSTAKNIVDETKAKGGAALYRVTEFVGIKKRLLNVRTAVFRLYESYCKKMMQHDIIGLTKAA